VQERGEVGARDRGSGPKDGLGARGIGWGLGEQCCGAVPLPQEGPEERRALSAQEEAAERGDRRREGSAKKQGKASEVAWKNSSALAGRARRALRPGRGCNRPSGRRNPEIPPVSIQLQSQEAAGAKRAETEPPSHGELKTGTNIHTWSQEGEACRTTWRAWRPG